MAEYQLWARNKRVLRENTWQHVDFVKAPTKNEAIVKWKRENPDKTTRLKNATSVSSLWCLQVVSDNWGFLG